LLKDQLLLSNTIGIFYGPIGDPSTDGSSFYTISVTLDDNGDNTDHTHYVFVEDATWTDCTNCPVISQYLHEIYESGDLPFYYISVVKDNDIANTYLTNQYNLLGYPTVYIDSGYKVILGGDNQKSYYEQQIGSAVARSTPKISVTINADLEDNSSDIQIEIIVENKEDQDYSGRLKVYLTEIISTRWQDHTGNPYHFAFLDFITNTDIEISANSQETFSETYSSSSYDPENLQLFAVVFNSEKNQGYSNPDAQENPFDAYYSDACDTAIVVPGGNLPPEIGIQSPSGGYLHILGNPLFKTLMGNTIIIGKTKIIAPANDDSAIEKVEFYIDDELVSSANAEPYEYEFRKVGMIKRLIKKHTIEVRAYDDSGKSATASLEVIGILL